VRIQTGIPMPVHPGWTWELEVFPDPVGEFRILQQTGSLIETNPSFQLGEHSGTTIGVGAEIKADEGATINVRGRVVSEIGEVVEESTFPAKWTHQREWQLSSQTAVAASGSFTETDRAQLQDVNVDSNQLVTNWEQYLSVTLPSLQQVLDGITAALQVTIQVAPGPIQKAVGEVLSIVSPDFWSDRDISGGVTCTRVDYDASFNALFGVTVIVESFPDDWRFQTPDHAWGFRDLAVLTFTRGGNDVERHGIHTLTHTVSPLPDFPWPWQSPIPIALQPGDTHITVDWAEGVCGRLVGHVLP